MYKNLFMDWKSETKDKIARRPHDIFTVVIFICLEPCMRGLLSIFARDFCEINFHE